MTLRELESLWDSRAVLAEELQTDISNEQLTLPELPVSEWRSIGKRFDYCHWDARDRFVELDAAILVRGEREDERNRGRAAKSKLSEALAAYCDHLIEPEAA